MKRTMSANMKAERLMLVDDTEFFYETDKKKKGHLNSVAELQMDPRNYETPCNQKEYPIEEIKETDNDMTTTFNNQSSAQKTSTFVDH